MYGTVLGCFPEFEVNPIDVQNSNTKTSGGSENNSNESTPSKTMNKSNSKITKKLNMIQEANRRSKRPFNFPHKEVVFISARVHPGEVPAQHTWKGIFDFLLNKTDIRAIELRRKYVFKVVPMLNPDGVYRYCMHIIKLIYLQHTVYIYFCFFV